MAAAVQRIPLIDCKAVDQTSSIPGQLFHFQNLDKNYAPDVVGDGNGNFTGQFEFA